MVNISLLEELHRHTENSRPMRKWSHRYRNPHNGYFYSIIQKIRRLLNLISGDDVVEMLKGLKILKIDAVTF
jgi:hypothetical protein